MILLDKDGICVDIAVYNINLWFLKEDRLLGKNLFQLIPLSTYNQIYPDFKKSTDAQNTLYPINYENGLERHHLFLQVYHVPL